MSSPAQNVEERDQCLFMIWSGETWSSSGRADEEDDMDVVEPDHPDMQKRLDPPVEELTEEIPGASQEVKGMALETLSLSQVVEHLTMVIPLDFSNHVCMVLEQLCCLNVKPAAAICDDAYVDRKTGDPLAVKEVMHPSK
ncbi:uncharacterized protein [Lolium perenne]|uniref:uncharacterized protein n=1 Tax=Lolium perenne TaxID=4522 RepID=UPI0021F560C5|nr:uncharacterized protein LOC127305966 [Lolium perenne]